MATKVIQPAAKGETLMRQLTIVPLGLGRIWKAPVFGSSGALSVRYVPCRNVISCAESERISQLAAANIEVSLSLTASIPR